MKLEQMAKHLIIVSLEKIPDYFYKHFMYLIDAVEPSAKQGSHTYYVLAYFCLSLRESVPLFSQIEISDQQLQELGTHCKTYFTLGPIVRSPFSLNSG